MEKPEQLSLAEFQFKTFPVLLIFCLPRTFYQGPELPPPPFSTFKTSGTDMTHWHFPHSSSAVDLWPSDKMESMFKHFLHWNLRLRCLPSLRENLFNKRQFFGGTINIPGTPWKYPSEKPPIKASLGSISNYNILYLAIQHYRSPAVQPPGMIMAIAMVTKLVMITPIVLQWLHRL